MVGSSRSRGVELRRRLLTLICWPLAAFMWAKEVPRDGAPLSPRSSAPSPLDFLRRRAALPLASREDECWSLAVFRRGNGSEPAMLGKWEGCARRVSMSYAVREAVEAAWKGLRETCR